MKKISFHNIDIKDGFWKIKQDMVRNVTVNAVYERFFETYRFDALECGWKEGDDEAKKPHKFWDSDVAKWIEGVSYLLKKERNDLFEKIIDNAVDNIIKNSDENGYFNSHFLVTEQNERFQDRDSHELYCLGHLIEAAIAYRDATGKDSFLKAMCKYTDYVERVFKIEKSSKFITPGHPELELALVKLYKATNEIRYLELAKYFVDMHGTRSEQEIFTKLYNQDEMPIRERTTIDGHSVRAFYLMCGVADVAMEYEDKELFEVCKRLFDNAINKRMYITGGTGSTRLGESFTIDYHLPNRTAYSETCASIALAMFAGRLQAMEVNSKYADIVERVLYNGFLSGISMKGDAFFYVNPLEIDLEFNDINKSTKEKEIYPIVERKKVFGCSCCPPNVVRFIPSIADYIYTYDDNIVYLHQYIASDMEFEGMKIIQDTNYPVDGAVKIKCSLAGKKLAIRIPAWCDSFNLNKEYTIVNGYAVISDPEDVFVEFDMPVKFMRANRKVHDNAGRVAVMRGPVVYCAEGVDNGRDLKCVRIDVKNKVELSDYEFILPSLTMKAYIDKESEDLYYYDDDLIEMDLKLIPYYAFANRGPSEMSVWILKK